MSWVVAAVFPPSPFICSEGGESSGKRAVAGPRLFPDAAVRRVAQAPACQLGRPEPRTSPLCGLSSNLGNGSVCLLAMLGGVNKFKRVLCLERCLAGSIVNKM